MKIPTATVIIHLSKEQTATRKNVTTAEAAILVGEHHKAFGDQPVEIIPGSEGEMEITGTQLYSYLLSRFGVKKVKNLFPTPTSRYPETFEEAKELGMATINPSDKLMEFEIK